MNPTVDWCCRETKGPSGPRSLVIPRRTSGRLRFTIGEAEVQGRNDLPKGSSYHPAKQVKLESSTSPSATVTTSTCPIPQRGSAPAAQINSGNRHALSTGSARPTRVCATHQGPVMTKTLTPQDSLDPLRERPHRPRWWIGAVISEAGWGSQGFTGTLYGNTLAAWEPREESWPQQGSRKAGHQHTCGKLSSARH